MKKFLIFFFLLSILSCNQQEEPQEKEPAVALEPKTPLKIRAAKLVALLPQAKPELMQWPAFLKLKNNIEQLPKNNLKELVVNTENLVKILSEMQTTLPSNYKVPPIESRINVLTTKTIVLQEMLKNPDTEISEIEKTASEIASGFEYLKIQFNELFMQSPSEFMIDLEELEAKQDSIVRARMKSSRETPPLIEAPKISPVRAAKDNFK